MHKLKKDRKDVTLVLADGKTFSGKLIGELAPEGRKGEIVFNTSMTGYQEIITDPSYRGQIVCFTYPSIGNYGITEEDSQSDRPYLEAVIMREYCEFPSNYRSTMSLEQYLSKNNVPAISGIDTRHLVRHIREQGSIMGGLFFSPSADEDYDKWLKERVAEIQNMPSMEGLNLTDIFDGKAANNWVAGYIDKNNVDIKKMKRVAVLDFGIKFSILENMLTRNIYPVVFPGNTPLEQWENFSADQFDGFFFSNGPGDPSVVKHGIENIRKIIDFARPMFGICLGHQMLSLALGAQTFKLKFGHHGGNQPVKAAHRNNVLITAQNHGFSVDEDSLRKAAPDVDDQFEFNPNDSTAEGFLLARDGLKVLSVQYHPEASPGPHDARIVFEEFNQML